VVGRVRRAVRTGISQNPIPGFGVPIVPGIGTK